MQAERKFIIDGIKQGLRCDGRGSLSSRSFEIQHTTELLAAGSSQLSIELSSPHLLCGIKAEISSSPDITLSIELAGKSSQQIRDQLKDISLNINQLVLNPLTIEELCIIPERKYWRLFIDVLILSENCSSLHEQIGLCIYSALSNTKLIKVNGFINKNTDEDFLQVTEESIRVNPERIPVIVSVGFVENCMVLDLASIEELCVESILHIAVDRTGKIKGIVKAGGGVLDFSQLSEAIKASKAAALQIFEKMTKGRIQYQVNKNS